MNFLEKIFGGDKSKALLALRKGMWVVHQGHVGILSDIRSDGVLEVHLADSISGDTVQIVTAGAPEVKQAKLHQIPALRRPKPEHGAKFGYI